MASTVPVDFNAADYVFLLDPDVYPGVTTDAARQHYLTVGSAHNLPYTMVDVPTLFQWTVYMAFVNDASRVNDKRTSVVDWLKSRAGSESYSVPTTFNMSLYRILYPASSFASATDTYIEYLKHSTRVFSSDGLLKTENPTLNGVVNIMSDLSGSSVLNVDGTVTSSNLTVFGEAHVTALTVTGPLDVSGSAHVSDSIAVGRSFVRGNNVMDVSGNVMVSGTITTSNLQLLGTSTVVRGVETVANYMTIRNIAGFGPALRVSQQGTGINYPIADFYDEDVSMTVPALRIADGGNVGLGLLAPTHTLDVSGNAYVSGALDVSGAVTLSGTAKAANLKVTGHVGVGVGGLDVSGGVGVGSTANALDVSGASAFSSNLAIGKAVAKYALDVSGAGAFSANVAIGKLDVASGALDVSGGAAVSGGVAVGKSFVSSSIYALDVSGSVLVSGSITTSNLHVLGSSVGAFSANVAVGKLDVVSGALDVSGGAAVSGGVAVGKLFTGANTLDVSGTAQVSGAVGIGGALDVSGAVGVGRAHTANALDVSGASAFSSNLAIGKAVAKYALDVSGAGAFSASVAIGKLDVASGALDVSGGAAVSGGVAVGKPFASGGGKALDVSGAALVSGAVGLGGALDVSGSLRVLGTATTSNLGVGAPPSAYPLDVSGNINFTGDLYKNQRLYVGSQWVDSSGNDGVSSNLYYRKGAVGIGRDASGSFALDVSGSVNFSGSLYQGGLKYVGSQWTTNGAAVYYSAGNVGVGVTGPAHALDVSGDVWVTGKITTSNLQVLGSSTVVNGVETVTSNVTISNTAGFGPALRVSQKGTGLNYPIADFYDEDVSTTVPALRIADGGNVGLGVLAPTHTLDVSGSAYVSGALDVSGSLRVLGTATTSNLGVGAPPSAYPLDVSGNINFTGNLYKNKQLYAVWVDSSSNLYYRKGAVGIGRDASGFALDVSGSVNFSGSLYQGGLKYVGSQWTTNGAAVYYSAGNVGIGVTGPTHALDVSGDVWVTGKITTSNLQVLGSSTVVNGVETVSSNVTINNTAGFGPALRVSQKGTGLNYPIADFYDEDVSGNINFTGDLYKNQRLYVGSQWVDSSGNDGVSSNLYFRKGAVGIGRDASGFALDVSGSVNFSGSLYQGGLKYVGSQWTTNGAAVCYTAGNVGVGVTGPTRALDVSGAVGIGGALDVSGITKLTRTLTVVGATALDSTLDVSGIGAFGSTVTVKGNVGVGTLDVSGAANVRGDLTVIGTLWASNVTVLGSVETVHAYETHTSNIVINNRGTGPALTVTQTESGLQNVAEFYNGAGVPALIIDNAGNLAVNMAMPNGGTSGAELDVSGSAKVSGTLFANNVAIGGSSINGGYALNVSGIAGFSSNVTVAGNIGVGTASAVGTPANGTSGGIGDRLVLFPGSAGSTPYSIGVNAGNLWHGVPTGMLHTWYDGTTVQGQLTNGTLTVTGDLVGFGAVSDSNLKTNVLPIAPQDALGVVERLQPVTFQWRDDIFNMAKRGSNDVGFLAQAVQQVAPLAITSLSIGGDDDAFTYMGIKHERLIPYLVGAVQALSRELQLLKNKAS